VTPTVIANSNTIKVFFLNNLKTVKCSPEQDSDKSTSIEMNVKPLGFIRLNTFGFVSGNLFVEGRAISLTVKPVYNGHPWDSKKVAFVQKWPLFRGWSLKIIINIDHTGCCRQVAVAKRWSLIEV